MKIKILAVLFLALAFSAHAKVKTAATLGAFQLQQDSCDKIGCDTWIKSGGATYKLGVDKKFGTLEPTTKSGKSNSPAIVKEQTLAWCSWINPHKA